MKTDLKKLIRMIVLIIACFVMKIGTQSNIEILRILGVISAVITMIMGGIILKECIEEWKNMKR